MYKEYCQILWLKKHNNTSEGNDQSKMGIIWQHFIKIAMNNGKGSTLDLSNPNHSMSWWLGGEPDKR